MYFALESGVRGGPSAEMTVTFRIGVDVGGKRNR